MEGGVKDDGTRRYGAGRGTDVAANVFGGTAPWNLLLSAARGVWLMFAPAMFGAQGRIADSGALSARSLAPSP